MPPAKKTSKTRNKKKKVEGKVLKKKRTKSAGPRKGYATPYAKAMKSRNFGAKKEASSKAGGIRQGGLMTGHQNRIRPRIEFWKRQQFYLTVGRVQNVTETAVLNIINRQHYYDAKESGKQDAMKDSIKKMEDWEEKVVYSDWVAGLIRNWIINGLHIFSPKDWLPLQLQSLESKTRDKEGNTLNYYQRIDGQEVKVPAADFIEVPYIPLDREPWPTGMFDSLMNEDFLDVDGKDAVASLTLYRQSMQDNMRIHHKLAAPRVVYTAEGVAKEVLDNDIVPVLEGMGPGDRAAFNTNLEIKQETVDSRARFTESVDKIVDEIDTGLQSSANRLITEPSAMADAREANTQDDDRTLGLMEKIRVLFNRIIIPRVTGEEPGKLVLKWGAKDAFDLEFPEPMERAIASGVVNPQQAVIMLEEQFHWKIPDQEKIKKKFGDAAIDPTKKPEEPEEKPGAGEVKDRKPVKPGEESVKMESSLSREAHSLDIQIKKEKLQVLKDIKQKINEV